MYLDTRIDKYVIFMKCVELGSFTKVAEALHYTQSGVSHAIASLESEMGFSLFIRSKKGVVLTQNGKKILGEVQNLVNQQENLKQKIYNVKNLVVGTIRVGTYISTSVVWLPTIIKLFQAKYPLVKFELFHGTYDMIQEWVQHGRVDCGFLSSPVTHPLYFHRLKSDPMLIALPTNHEFCRETELTVDDIISEPFILPNKGADRDVRKIISSVKKSVNISYVLNNDISVISMISKGFGISIVPELLLRIGSFKLTTRPLSPPRNRTLGICSLPMHSISTITQVFIKFLSNPQNIDFDTF